MDQNISTLSKKTKAEILNEYQKLLSSIENAKDAAHAVYEPTNAHVITAAHNAFTTTGVETAISELKTSTSSKMTELAKNVSSNLDALLRQMLDDVEKFENLRQAIDLREKQLQSLYHVEVAATTLETLVAEYADKKRAFELEHTTQHAELSDSIATKKRSWQREEEEYEYTLKLHRTREQSQFEEGIRKKEAEFQVREDTIKTTEDELETLRSRVANISAEQEKFLQTAEQNVTKRLVAEHTAHTALLEKTWESEKRIFELSFANLETQYKRLETEVIHLKKEAESAQKKAQELAVTVIEHGGRHSVHRNDMRENDEKNAATAT